MKGIICLKRIFNDSDCDTVEDSSSEEEILYIMCERKRTKIDSYQKIIELYDNKDFQVYFRLSRAYIQVNQFFLYFCIINSP